MKIINSTSVLNLVNNGFVYLCQVDDGTYWLRSTAGKWVQIKSSTPVDVDTLDIDFQAFIKANILVTENDVKIDNSSQIVVDPVILVVVQPTAPDISTMPGA